MSITLLFLLILSIIQSMAISLGVGASTIAIVNFFYAIADGKIEETERNFMGVTYIVLRVAMVIILLTWLIKAMYGYGTLGAEYFTNYIIGQAILISILYVNAILMTARIMPSTFGPAIQASSWYTLGFIMTIVSHDLEINMVIFTSGYIAVLLFATALVNGLMAYIKARREVNTPATPV